MILLVREATTYLTAHGLSDLTVSRSDQGYVQLVGRACQKPLITITSINVSNKLTAKEREIIMDDYIKPAIDKYKDDILELMRLAGDTTTADDLEHVTNAIETEYGARVDATSYVDYYDNARDRDLCVLVLKSKTDEEDNSYVQTKATISADTGLCKTALSSANASLKEIGKAARELLKIKDDSPKILKEFNEAFDADRVHKDKIGETKEAFVEKCKAL